MRKLVENIYEIKVYRNDHKNFHKPTKILTTELVPGDIL